MRKSLFNVQECQFSHWHNKNIICDKIYILGSSIKLTKGKHQSFVLKDKSNCLQTFVYVLFLIFSFYDKF